MSRSRRTVVVVIGLSLVALGAGNAITGWTKMQDYRERKHAAVAAGGESVKRPLSDTTSILDASTDAQLLYESAAIKYDYYRVVQRGGFLMLGMGTVLLVGTAVSSRLRRRRRGRLVELPRS